MTSRQQVDELTRALNRPRIQKYGVTATEIARLLRRLASHADLITPQLPAAIPVRDPHDEHMLALALDSKADYLVTGDEDLLVLAGDERLGSLAIVTVAEFLRILDDDKAESAPLDR